MCKLKKKKIQMNLFTKQKQTHRHRKQIYGNRRGKGWGINQEFGITIYKIDNKDLLYSTGNCIQYLVINCNGKEKKRKGREGTNGIKVIVKAQYSKITRKRYEWRDHSYKGQLSPDPLVVAAEFTIKIMKLQFQGPSYYRSLSSPSPIFLYM